MASNYAMVLCMVKLEDGLTIEQINKTASMLHPDKTWIPIDFHDNNTSAYGYVEQSHYEACDYNNEVLNAYIDKFIGNWDNIKEGNIYPGVNGEPYYISFMEHEKCGTTGRISFNINNRQILTLTQYEHDRTVHLQSGDREDIITPGDMVMLTNYHHNCKTGKEISDYIKPAGKP
jgi:hypothetical protein